MSLSSPYSVGLQYRAACYIRSFEPLVERWGWDSLWVAAIHRRRCLDFASGPCGEIDMQVRGLPDTRRIIRIVATNFINFLTNEYFPQRKCPPENGGDGDEEEESREEEPHLWTIFSLRLKVRTDWVDFGLRLFTYPCWDRVCSLLITSVHNFWGICSTSPHFSHIQSIWKCGSELVFKWSYTGTGLDPLRYHFKPTARQNIQDYCGQREHDVKP